MLENVVGKTYGLLTVLAEAERVGWERKVLVRCSCEAATEKIVYLSNIRSSNTTSCGCVKKAVSKVKATTHGLHLHPLYGTWKQMLQRCQNPNDKAYPDYGGRGIAVCESWQKFENFYADMQPAYEKGLTLDRKDNDQGYNPENCKWATRTEQNRNKRSNVNVTLRGKTQCLTAWCQELNLNCNTVYTRIHRSKTPEQALQIQKNST
jgi:hypothetical protein